MTDNEKLATLKSIMGITGTDYDTQLSSFLTLSKKEILSWLYTVAGGVPSGVTDVPEAWEPAQIMAVVVGFGAVGAEGQTTHGENGINRVFKYPTFLAYIHDNVVPYAGVG